MERKTSSVAGAKRVEREALQRTNEMFNSKMSKDEGSKFWSTVNKVMEQIPQATLDQKGFESGKTYKYIYERFAQGADQIEIAQDLKDDMNLMQDATDEEMEALFFNEM